MKEIEFVVPKPEPEPEKKPDPVDSPLVESLKAASDAIFEATDRSKPAGCLLHGLDLKPDECDSCTILATLLPDEPSAVDELAKVSADLDPPNTKLTLEFETPTPKIEVAKKMPAILKKHTDAELGGLMEGMLGRMMSGDGDGKQARAMREGIDQVLHNTTVEARRAEKRGRKAERRAREERKKRRR